MPTFEISLQSVDAVKEFANAAIKLPCDVDARSGHYIVNAKSIMGLFSMDLAKPVEIVVHGTALQAESLMAECAAHLVTGK